VDLLPLAQAVRRDKQISKNEAKRLKELEKENARLKRLLAEKELDRSSLREALEGNY
jgi:putative transposase